VGNRALKKANADSEVANNISVQTARQTAVAAAGESFTEFEFVCGFCTVSRQKEKVCLRISDCQAYRCNAQ